MDLTGLEFIGGVEMSNGSFFLSTQDPNLSLRSNPHSGLVLWTAQDGWQELGMEPQITVDVATAKDGTVAMIMDPFGNILEFDGEYLDETKVTDAAGEPPRFELRCMRGIGGSVHVGGVGRLGYRRQAGGAWQMTTTEAMQQFDTPVAFAGIDGFSDSELYAAGWEGEIWSFDGRGWTSQHSPTNLILNDICAGPDICVAVGLSGRVMSGRGDSWKMIEHDATSEPFWSVRAYDGAFYMSTINGIYKLENGEVTLFQSLDGIVRTSYALAVGPSGLWSIGSQDVALFDGNTWQTIAQS